MKKVYKCLSQTAVFLAFLGCSFMSFAQDRNVSGTVKDETGSPMPGVNVIVKGTTSGTATDGDGKYTLSVSTNAILVFTFVGYSTSEVPVGSQTTVDVQMNPDATSLSEIVVTGYSSQRKQDITGAVSVVKLDEMQNIQAASISQKLEGRASGVQISTSGEPGEGTNIRIRGIASFQLSNDPLWIIDGVQSTDKGNTWLNPNDIESIQVLKDASAASIYGSRANNGVIIVTTKKGKAGKTKIDYSGYVGVQNAVSGYNKIISTNPIENAKAFQSYFDNSSGFTGIPSDNYYYQYDVNGTLPEYVWPVSNLGTGGDLISPANGAVVGNINDYYYSQTDDDGLIMGSNPSGTDWWSELFQPASMTEHNINVSGGSENSSFNIGGGYFKQEGTMIYTNFERLSLRANSSFKLGKVTLGENVTFARTFRTTQIGSNQDNQNSITNTLLMHPIIPIYDIGGNFAGAKALSNGSNPVAAQYRNKDNGTTSYKVFGNFFGEAQFTDWLKFKSSFGFDYANWVFTGFNFATPENREPTLNNGFSENWNNNFLWQWSNTLELNKKFGNHQVNAFIGYESIKSVYRGISGRINNYFTDNINAWYLNTGIGDAATRTVSSSGDPSTLVSMFGKIDYAYNEKYLISGTVRRDGSSKFGKNNRWGVFPAFSLGWRVSSEQFMSSIGFINDLKLRFGYGVTGNQQIQTGNGFDQYGGLPATTFYDINGSGSGSIATGYALTRVGNPDGKWEENESVNGGLDLSAFNGKLQFVFDVYKRQTNGLLYQPTAVGTQGSAQLPFYNVGDMKNEGIDISLSYRGSFQNGLGYTASVNATHYKNTILYVNDDTDFFFSGGADGHGNYVRNQVGYPMASFYGYEYLGPIRSDAEALSLPTGVGGSNFAGGWSFNDRNGNGSIDPEDRTIIGNPHPDLTLGVNLGLNYKSFDFNMFLFASIGNDIYNYQKYYYETGRWGSVFSKDILSTSWTPENPNAKLPQLNVDNTNSADVASSYYIEDGSYLRAKSIQIGYNVPGNILSKIAGSSARARFFIQTQNLFTITGYSGIDPVLSNVNIGDGNANDQYLGTDLGNYPSSRVFSVGLTFGF